MTLNMVAYKNFIPLFLCDSIISEHMEFRNSSLSSILQWLTHRVERCCFSLGTEEGYMATISNATVL